MLLLLTFGWLFSAWIFILFPLLIFPSVVFIVVRRGLVLVFGLLLRLPLFGLGQRGTFLDQVIRTLAVVTPFGQRILRAVGGQMAAEIAAIVTANLLHLAAILGRFAPGSSMRAFDLAPAHGANLDGLEAFRGLLGLEFDLLLIA